MRERVRASSSPVAIELSIVLSIVVFELSIALSIDFKIENLREDDIKKNEIGYDKDEDNKDIWLCILKWKMLVWHHYSSYSHLTLLRVT